MRHGHGFDKSERLSATVSNVTDAPVRALDGGPQLWTRSGWGYRVDNRDQLLRAIGRVATLSQRRIYAWRGQRDASWPLVSSLYRHLAKSGSVDEQRMREVERQIVLEARKYGLGRDLGASNTDAHLLASLQHHGTPTRLIDVTSNPFTAL
ncbi:FRG domain-containing protein [Cellulosimicrobium sp. TH-20]|uniref:FRG domain-containing protein n=1 Tax=Cellulosimicrobium sp. TH-20 TaxID=1980001 RepID=UPI001649E80C